MSIYHGDCFEWLKTVADDTVDCVVTDPPYDIANTTAGKSAYQERIQRNMDELKELSITDGFNEQVLDELVRVCKGINMYFFCNKAQLPMYFDYFVTKHGCSFDLIKWVKTNPVPAYSNKYISDTEYCFYARKGGYCNPENYADGSTLYRSPLNKKDKDKYGHPTIKPLPLLERLIRNSSKPGQLILDPYMGSGSTAVAAINMGRDYIGAELTEKYYKICQQRIKEAELSNKPNSILNFI